MLTCWLHERTAGVARFDGITRNEFCKKIVPIEMAFISRFFHIKIQSRQCLVSCPSQLLLPVLFQKFKCAQLLAHYPTNIWHVLKHEQPITLCPVWTIQNYMHPSLVKWGRKWNKTKTTSTWNFYLQEQYKVKGSNNAHSKAIPYIHVTENSTL